MHAAKKDCEPSELYFCTIPYKTTDTNIEYADEHAVQRHGRGQEKPAAAVLLIKAREGAEYRLERVCNLQLSWGGEKDATRHCTNILHRSAAGYSTLHAKLMRKWQFWEAV